MINYSIPYALGSFLITSPHYIKSIFIKTRIFYTNDSPSIDWIQLQCLGTTITINVIYTIVCIIDA